MHMHMRYNARLQDLVRAVYIINALTFAIYSAYLRSRDLEIKIIHKHTLSSYMTIIRVHEMHDPVHPN